MPVESLFWQRIDQYTDRNFTPVFLDDYNFKNRTAIISELFQNNEALYEVANSTCYSLKAERPESYGMCLFDAALTNDSRTANDTSAQVTSNEDAILSSSTHSEPNLKSFVSLMFSSSVRSINDRVA